MYIRNVPSLTQALLELMNVRDFEQHHFTAEENAMIREAVVYLEATNNLLWKKSRGEE